MCAFLTCENAFLTLIQGKVGCAQSILHLEKPKNRRFSHKNPKMFDFRFNTPIPSLNQGQGSVFKVRECAQSIPRIKLPLEGHLLKNFFLIFYPDPVLDFCLKKALFLEGCCMERWSAKKTRTYIWLKAAAYLSRWCTPLENKKRISVQTSFFDF